jgi:hypothetical protein
MNGNNPFRPEGRLRAIVVRRSVIPGHDVPSAFADASQIVAESIVQLAGAILQLAPNFSAFPGAFPLGYLLASQML